MLDHPVLLLLLRPCYVERLGVFGCKCLGLFIYRLVIVSVDRGCNEHCLGTASGWTVGIGHRKSPPPRWGGDCSMSEHARRLEAIVLEHPLVTSRKDLGRLDNPQSIQSRDIAIPSYMHVTDASVFGHCLSVGWSWWLVFQC